MTVFNFPRYQVWQLPETVPGDWLIDQAWAPLLRQIAWNRGLRTADEMDVFMNPKYDQHLPDPWRYHQMSIAVDRIRQAIRQREPILVYGDYDADGVTTTTIMVEALRTLGGQVEWYVPERISEGYGLNEPAVIRFAEQGIKLIVAVDCGSTNSPEVVKARELGMDVIIIDHHQLSAARPPALAIINPADPAEKFPDAYPSAGGVAYAVVRALDQVMARAKELPATVTPGWEKWLLDLVAISTVTDMVPLRGENRILVRYGLAVLAKTKRPGLKALLAIIGVDPRTVDEHTIGFQIGPRLNAAGRLDHAASAVKMLLARDSATAQILAADLQRVNIERQRLTEMTVVEANDRVNGTAAAGLNIAYAPHWSPGVLGLVAGRIADKTGKPTIIMTATAGRIVGSGRSPGGCDMVELISGGQEHLSRFGGHPGACGFTLVDAEPTKFIDWLRLADLNTPTANIPSPLKLDGSIKFSEYNDRTLDDFETLRPFGTGHGRPVFLHLAVDVVGTYRVGAQGAHLSIRLREGGEIVKAIGFRWGEKQSDFTKHRTWDVVVEPSWNHWRGRREKQYKLIDARPS